MKAILISCFDNSFRISTVKLALENLGYEVIVVVSNFNHIRKEFVEKQGDKYYICVNPYKRNLSIARLFSHYNFSKQITKFLNRENPDLIYAIIPPNTLVKQCAKYVKKRETKLYFDIIDMWPESMPLNGLVNKFLEFPFKIWGRIRDNYLNFADGVITECDLYQEKIKENGINLPYTMTLHLGQAVISNKLNPVLTNDKFDICYLGSINNIIDIPVITKFLEVLNNYKPVTLHIIGDGENRETLINSVKATKVEVINHGKIFDLDKKLEIINHCQFGLNIMIDKVVVGLTMKSIDYLQAGLPLLNNIKADTWRLVEKDGIGYNIYNNYEIVAKKIADLSIEEMLMLRKKVSVVFERDFDNNYLTKKLEKFIGGK